jgi:hypothetical protein
MSRSRNLPEFIDYDFAIDERAAKVENENITEERDYELDEDNSINL